MSERSALRLQLEAENGRRSALERQLQTVQMGAAGGAGGSGGAHRIDMMPLLGVEHAAGGRRGGGGGEFGQMQASRYCTRLLNANVRRPRPTFVAAAAAVNWDLGELLDRGSLTFGRHLRAHRPLEAGAGRHTSCRFYCWIVVLLVQLAPSLPAEPRAFVPSDELASRHRNLTRMRNRMDRF